MTTFKISYSYWLASGKKYCTATRRSNKNQFDVGQELLQQLRAKKKRFPLIHKIEKKK